MVLIPILLTYMVNPNVWFSGLLQAIKHSKVHHFADDASLKLSSSIKLTNKQVNDNFKVNSSAYTAKG